MPKKEFLVATCSGKEQRLDIFLAEKISALSRSQIKKLIEKKKVRVDGVLRKSTPNKQRLFSYSRLLTIKMGIFINYKYFDPFKNLSLKTFAEFQM